MRLSPTLSKVFKKIIDTKIWNILFCRRFCDLGNVQCGEQMKNLFNVRYVRHLIFFQLLSELQDTLICFFFLTLQTIWYKKKKNHPITHKG